MKQKINLDQNQVKSRINTAKEFFKYAVPSLALVLGSGRANEVTKDTVYLPLSMGTVKNQIITQKDTLKVFSKNDINGKMNVDSIAINNLGKKVAKELSKGDSLEVNLEQILNIGNRKDTLRYIIKLTNLGLAESGKETTIKLDSAKINVNDSLINVIRLNTNAKFFLIGKNKNFDSLNVDTVYIIGSLIYYLDKKQIDSTTTKDTLQKVKGIRIIDKSNDGKYINYNAYIEGRYLVVEANDPDSLKQKYLFDLTTAKLIGFTLGDGPLNVDSTGNIKGLIKYPYTKRGTLLNYDSSMIKIPQYVKQIAAELLIEKDTIIGKEENPSGVNEKGEGDHGWPNPTSTIYRLAQNYAYLREVKIINIENGNVTNKQVNNGEINVEDLPSGAYIILDGITSKPIDKIIKQ